MSLTQLFDRLRQSIVYLRVQGMNFPVICKDIRSAYNRVDVLVTPKDGAGSKWVSISSLSTDFDPYDYLR